METLDRSLRPSPRRRNYHQRPNERGRERNLLLLTLALKRERKPMPLLLPLTQKTGTGVPPLRARRERTRGELPSKAARKAGGAEGGDMDPLLDERVHASSTYGVSRRARNGRCM